MSKRILVIGGDARIDTLYASMRRDSLDVARYTEDIPLKTALSRADVIILGLPASADGATVYAPQLLHPILMNDLLSLIDGRRLLLGGKFDEKTRALMDVYGIKYVDYLKREEFEIANAVPTAEGAVQTAMEELPITLNGANVIITGYGRIGKQLARLLGALGSSVTVFARRRTDFALIKSAGFTPAPYSLLPETARRADVLFNTVPARVIGRAALDALRGGLIIDLASAPYGCDLSEAAEAEVRVIRAGGLPGKVAPVTAGEIIKETIYNIFRETGE